MGITEFIINWLITIPRLPILILFSLASLCLGIFLILKPYLAIQIQKKFYEKINWRMEPISVEKEIRNTRAMGWFLIILSVTTLFFVLTKTPSFL